MTNERARSELNQIYGMLSEEKKKALDVAFKAMEQADNIPVMHYPQVDGITPTVVAQADGEYIRRQAVLDITWEEPSYTDALNVLTEVRDKVKELPSVKPQEKAGHWIEHPEIETSTPEYLMFYECSECGDKQCFCKSDIHKKHFCNNCGAKMD